MGRGAYRHRVAAALVLAAAAYGVPAVLAGEAVDPSSGLESLPVEALPVLALAPPLDAGATTAAFAPAAADLASFRRTDGQRRFFAGHLMPRFERQFDGAMRVEAAPLAGHGLADHALYDWMADDAAARAERATRKALRDSLLETATLSRIVSWAESRGDRLDVGGDGARTGGRPRVDLDVGISGGLPRLTLSRGVGDGLFRAGVSARGTAGLSYSHPSLRGVHLAAGWDPGDDRVDLGCRVGF